MQKANDIYEYIKGKGATKEDFNDQELLVLSILFENLNKDDQIGVLQYFKDRNRWKSKTRKHISTILCNLKKSYFIHMKNNTLPLQDGLGIYKYFVDKNGEISEDSKRIVQVLFQRLSFDKQNLLMIYFTNPTGLSDEEKVQVHRLVDNLKSSFGVYSGSKVPTLYGKRDIYKFFTSITMTEEEKNVVKERVNLVIDNLDQTRKQDLIRYLNGEGKARDFNTLIVYIKYQYEHCTYIKKHNKSI